VARRRVRADLSTGPFTPNDAKNSGGNLPDRGSDGCALARLLAAAVALGCLGAAPHCIAADLWGGSLALTSDYFVRGISRTDDRAALQLDLHYLNPSGFLAGLFASNAQIDPGEPRDAELSAFLGYVWSPGADWHGKILATHYSYPWNRAGSQYNYDEVDLEVVYRGWLDLRLSYSPDSPRSVLYRSGTVSAESAELGVQRPLVGRLSANAGIGYYYLKAPNATGYTYGSAGAAYDWGAITLAVAYVRTSAAANALFYNAAVGGRWTGTIIWRF
jgi:uncharacterized protein (TIGR02001 family)